MSTWSKGYLPITCQFSRYRVPIRSNPIDDDIHHVGGPSMHFPLRKPYPKVCAYYTTLRVVTYYCLMARWREYYRIYNIYGEPQALNVHQGIRHKFPASLPFLFLFFNPLRRFSGRWQHHWPLLLFSIAPTSKKWQSTPAIERRNKYTQTSQGILK